MPEGLSPGHCPERTELLARPAPPPRTARLKQADRSGPVLARQPLTAALAALLRWRALDPDEVRACVVDLQGRVVDPEGVVKKRLFREATG